MSDLPPQRRAARTAPARDASGSEARDASGGGARGAHDEAPAARTREVAPGVHEVFLPLPSKPSIVNVWLLDCGDQWVLIDTGVALEASRTAFEAALRGLGLAPGDVGTVIGTHHHPDHFGASEDLRAAGAARFFLHPAELERIDYALSAGAEDMVRHSRRHGVPIPAGAVDAPKPSDVWARVFRPTREVDRFLKDGEVLEIGTRRLEIVWTPGHTPGHCCILDREQRVFFVGDHLLPRITPHVGVYATGPRNPLGDFLDSQEKVARLDVALVCPAHGGVYTDHRHRARQLIAHHEYRMREMLDTVQAGPATAYEVARRSFRWVFEDGADRFHMGAAVMETLAHLELLAARGAIAPEERDGVVRFRAARSA
ncbi:MAG: hypothetical protein RL698_1569 [Pseudomonadota bacterium]|jgi:glyoxylase-like metal-dependent hydrolase (beta-lactamase superfamily II)